jgi:hypothetical protein
MRQGAPTSQAKAVRLASIVTAANVLIASGFSIAGLIAPAALFAAARTIPLALAALLAIYNRSTIALLVLGALAGLVQLVDGFIGLYQNDLGKTIGPLIIAVLQFYAVFRLERSARIAP